jgi:hypothetical protein
LSSLYFCAATAASCGIAKGLNPETQRQMIAGELEVELGCHMYPGKAVTDRKYCGFSAAT